MKKWVAVFMVSLMAFALISCSGTENDDASAADQVSFDILEDCQFSFFTGVGAWNTQVEFGPDGEFSGEFWDWNGGDSDENANLYCSFSGKLKYIHQAGEYRYEATVDGDLKYDDEYGTTAEKDGELVKYVEPYGFENYRDGDTIIFLMPGYPVGDISEEAASWLVFYNDMNEELPDKLNSMCIYNEEMGYLLIGGKPDVINSEEDEDRIDSEEAAKGSGAVVGIWTTADEDFTYQLSEDGSLIIVGPHGETEGSWYLEGEMVTFKYDDLSEAVFNYDSAGDVLVGEQMDDYTLTRVEE